MARARKQGDENGTPAAEAPVTRDSVVAARDVGLRLDKWLATRFPDRSRSRLKALVEAGAVTLDGSPVRDASFRLEAGQRVHLDTPPPVPARPAAEAIPLAIVFEDGDLVVVDKPAGLVVHPAAGHVTGTLVNALIHHCRASLSGIGGELRPGIVHRLDKDTSGLIVAAKNDRAHQHLAAQFADHGRTGALEREYTAIVWGVPARSAGLIDAPLDRHPQDRERRAVVRPGRGREAVTHYRVLETFRDQRNQPVASLVACRLETGRTHQIRVHMAHIGHPLVADPLYATGFRTKAGRLAGAARRAVEGLGRQALHAGLLAFAHPRTGEILRLESPLPPDLTLLIREMRQSS